jgi:polyhydroxyalkanoate synthesis regulator protein
MKMFSPFAFAKPGETAASPPPPAATPAKAEPAQDEAVAELRKQMEAMQAQIEKQASKS